MRSFETGKNLDGQTDYPITTGYLVSFDVYMSFQQFFIQVVVVSCIFITALKTTPVDQKQMNSNQPLKPM